METNNESKKELLEKIKKLFALANNNTSKHEAELAAQKAHTLLLKHNLSMSEVSNSTPEWTEEKIEASSGTNVLTSGISHILREHYLVDVYYVRHGGRRFSTIIFGSPSNVEVAKYVHTFLKSAIHALWLSYKRENNASMRAKNSFILGVIKGLHDKLQESAKKFEQQYGIIPVNAAMVESRKNKNLKHSNTAVNRDEDASAAGYHAGKNLNIAPGLKHESKQTSLALSR